MILTSLKIWTINHNLVGALWLPIEKELKVEIHTIEMLTYFMLYNKIVRRPSKWDVCIYVPIYNTKIEKPSFKRSLFLVLPKGIDEMCNEISWYNLEIAKLQIQ